MNQLKVIGRGANGIVYAYTPALYDQLSLVKIVRDYEQVPKQGFAVKFGIEYDRLPLAANTTEYDLLNRLQHPRIVPLFIAFRWTQPKRGINPLGLLLPRALGSLDDLAEQDALTSTELSRALVDVMLGLEYLHAQDYIHRDLKEHNVLVFRGTDLNSTTNLVATLADFGSVYDLHNPSCLMRGRQCTYNYSAPEALFSNQYGKPADVWSLGVMIITVLTDWRPPTADSAYPLHDSLPVGIYNTLPHLLTTVPSLEQLQRAGLSVAEPFSELSSDHWWYYRTSLTRSLGEAGVALLQQIFQLDPAARPTVTELLDSPVFARYHAYISELRQGTSALVRPAKVQSIQLEHSELGADLLALIREHYQLQARARPLSPEEQFLYAQTLAVLDRFLPYYELQPELHRGAQLNVLYGVILNTISEYYQINAGYNYSQQVLPASKFFSKPAYVELAVDLSYQLLAAFPKGDLMPAVEIAALLAYLE